MTVVFDVANFFIEHARQTHGDDIGIIAYYGSYATGALSPTSDLDMFYIPDPDVDVPLCSTFVYQGLPYDFWPVRWEFAERIASANQRWDVAAPLIADARVLYHRSRQDLERFEGLKGRIADLLKPESRALMVGKALEAYQKAVLCLNSLRLAGVQHDASALRLAGWELLLMASECLALLNQTYFTKSLAADWAQAERLRLKPAHLEELYAAVALAKDMAAVRRAAEEMLDGIRALLLAEQKNVSPRHTLQDVFSDYYPVVLEYVNKILSACEKRNLLAAGQSAAIIQRELASMLAQACEGAPAGDADIYGDYRATLDRLQFPDLLMAVDSGDFARIAGQARLLDERMKGFLAQNGIAMNCFSSEAELRAFFARNDRS
jgi:hypothetical protein